MIGFLYGQLYHPTEKRSKHQLSPACVKYTCRYTAQGVSLRVLPLVVTPAPSTMMVAPAPLPSVHTRLPLLKEPLAMTLNQPANLAARGYQIVRELGRNWEGGRITYLATTLDHRQVVLKEFRFAAMESGWSGYKAHEREIEVLQQLDHPRIPRYLDSFETLSGFCLVQQYQAAPSLAERSSFTPEAVKEIALSVLAILVYLQERVPSIIHRDIKPENILVDKQLNAYLIDFGFARIRGGELALSSVAAGTPGFIPPEEQFGRPLSKASDLYSLGATLICLLTGVRSTEIHKLLDERYRFTPKQLLPQLHPRFLEWLSKLVEPSPKHRYADAAIALKSLTSMPVRQNRAKRVGVNLLKAAIGLSVMSGGIVWAVSSFLNSPKIANNYTQIPIQPELQTDLIKRLIETRMCRGCDLRKAQLVNANLQGVDLAYAALKNANLASADLSGANLRGANLQGANLQGANLNSANLRHADLNYVKLTQASLQFTSLRDVDLEHTRISNADLYHANLRGANLRHSTWDNVDFSFTAMHEVNATGAKLQRSTFIESELNRANFEGAIFEDNKMDEVDLIGANLAKVRMISVDLTTSNFTNASLTGANLRFATLEGANLTNTNLSGATMPDNSIHP